jgi:hypothetical protein
MLRSSTLFARLGLFVLLVLPFTVLGCGKPVGKVSGKVTKGGTPLPGGTITYVSADGKVKLSGEIKPEDGTYSIPNVPVGDGKFGIDNSSLRGTSMPGTSLPDPQKMAGTHLPDDLPKPAAQGKYVPIDPKYKDPNTSGLSWTVKRGNNNDVDFEVK